MCYYLNVQFQGQRFKAGLYMKNTVLWDKGPCILAETYQTTRCPALKKYYFLKIFLKLSISSIATLEQQSA